jgi:Family of unknown function (DUF5343)
MAVTADKPAPYAPHSAITDIIARYRSRGLPTPIDAEVLGRAGVSESLITRVSQALQSLDLVDESGMPTPMFEGIRVAPEGEYKQRLADWLKAAYADVFAFVDPSNDDETSIRDAFRNYQPIGQQSRMVTLFQGLCAAAGLMAEKPQQVRSPSAAPRARPATTMVRAASSKSSAKGNQVNSGFTGGSNVPPPLAGLLASLPAMGAGWTQAERDKYVTTFGAVLDFCFPIIEKNGDDGQT